MRTPTLVAALFLLGSALPDVRSAETPGVAAAPDAALLPDGLAREWVKALRHNDPSAGFALLPANDQRHLGLLWQRQVGRPDAYTDVQIDTVLRMAQNSSAVDQAMAMAQPYLAMVDVPGTVKVITDIAGLLTMAAESTPPGNVGGLDHAGLRDWLVDLAKWVPTAGFADQGKARLAAGHLITAIKASGLSSAAELRSMPLPTLLQRLGPALPALKQALMVYDVGVDALLDSFNAKVVEATADQALLDVEFTSLGKPRIVTLKLVQKNGAWQLPNGNDNPLTGLSQLVMMSLLMQGMGGAPAPAQPPTTVTPEDDGAL